MVDPECSRVLLHACWVGFSLSLCSHLVAFSGGSRGEHQLMMKPLIRDRRDARQWPPRGQLYSIIQKFGYWFRAELGRNEVCPLFLPRTRPQLNIVVKPSGPSDLAIRRRFRKMGSVS